MKFISVLIIFLGSAFSNLKAEDLKTENIDLGGFNVRYYTKGDAGPPLIMFHGAGNIALVWTAVIESLDIPNRVVAIDEAGAGGSDFGQKDNTIRQRAYDAMRTLKASGIEGPYILIGQSLGGLTALEFARQFKDQVKGVILVDSSHPNIILSNRQPDGTFKKAIMRELANDDQLPEVSSNQIQKERDVNIYPPRERDLSSHLVNIPDQYHEAYKAGYYKEMRLPVGYKDHFSNEMASMFDHWADYNLGDIPLEIITAADKSYEDGDKFSREFLINNQNEKIKSFESLSTNSNVYIAYGVGHAVHMEAPFIVKDAILRLLNP